jgi:hypothetical protein
LSLARTLRATAAAAFLAAFAAFPAHAATSGVDHSDLWWDPAESGWGAGLQQNGEVIFLTLYIHDATGASDWLVASDMRPLVFVAPAPPTWQGALYRARAAGFSAAYDGVDVQPVGTATLTFTSATTAQLRYDVGSTGIVKNIQRFNIASSSLSGSYYGGSSWAASACTDPNMNAVVDILGATSVTHDGNRVTIAVTSSSFGGVDSRCTFAGDYAQAGRLGRVAGEFSCNLYGGLDNRGEDPTRLLRRGSFVLERIESSRGGFSGALSATDQDCVLSGTIGGVRLP